MKLMDRLREHARVRGQQAALEWPGHRMDYRTLVEQVEAVSSQLRQRGLRTLAVDLDNGPAWALLDIASLSMDLCLIPLPAFFSTHQLRHVLEQSGAQAVVTSNPAGLAARLGGDGMLPASEISIAGQRLGLLGLKGDPDKVPTGVHKVTFTSGTTGEPKGVMLAWRHMEPVVRSLSEVTGIRPDDRHLCLLPLAVLLENIGGLYVPLWTGATTILPTLREVGLSGSSGLDAAAMANALGAHRASTAIFTPQSLQGLVEVVESGLTKPSTLRFAAVGGAPVSQRLLVRAARLGLPVYEGYGLSECASVVCLNTPGRQRVGSVGRPLPHVNVRVTADGGVEVKGAGFAGYLGVDDPVPEWWRTGDVGRLDGEGYLHLWGRRRNVFITAFGRNVAPEWVERELTLEPAIAQAAVFGEARPWNSAVIVPTRGARPEEVDQAIQRTNALLPDYARVARWLPAEEPFSPANGLLTGTGRIRRDRILDRYHSDIEYLYHEENRQ
jgi:long-subunit acyl-CoA synthetase (AMP-forming)